ncbi:hypothetical protein EDC65_3000 [Stella humosa]|uniref:Uncharacterized protein n=1 Tax=Stella humosa TaxID=94 RepID=A0A3N1LHX5_9PROT|nr:hypothetical protein EDC65_3000 [Stella humosa]
MPLLHATRIARDASPALRQIARTVAHATAPARPYADRAVSSITFFGIGFLVGTACWLMMREYVAEPNGFAASWLMVMLIGLVTGTLCGFAAMAVAATLQAARARPPASLAHLPDPSPLATVGPLLAPLVAAVRSQFGRWGGKAGVAARQPIRASTRSSAPVSSHSMATRSTATRARQEGGKRTASLAVVTSRAPKPAAKPSKRKSSSPRKR